MLTLYVLVLSSVAVLLLFVRTMWALNRFAHRPVAPGADHSPSVSVCIAARNETHALAQCLERVLKSDYAKLEILVLDDSSNDDTSLIIKSFANAGVRFIAGSRLPDGWLGKNHAYQDLIDEASGDYVLFLDVDTTIRPTTVSQLVAQLVANERSMLSVLPRREDSYRPSAIFGTMRYYWELLLASRTSPPAASALWMVERAKLTESGVGLSNYGMSVRPERHLARQLQRNKDYYYLIGTQSLGVGYEKHLKSQYETALRLYYPMTGRNILRWLVATLYLLLLIAPLGIMVADMYSSRFVPWTLALIVLLAVSYGMFTWRTYGRIAWQLRIIFGPILTVQELVLLFYSYFSYLFRTVTWKGRPINAQPVHHDALKLNE